MLQMFKTYSKTFLEHFKLYITCHDLLDDGKNMAAIIGGIFKALVRNICVTIARRQT